MWKPSLWLWHCSLCCKAWVGRSSQPTSIFKHNLGFVERSKLCVQEQIFKIIFEMMSFHLVMCTSRGDASHGESCDHLLQQLWLHSAQCLCWSLPHSYEGWCKPCAFPVAYSFAVDILPPFSELLHQVSFSRVGWDPEHTDHTNLAKIWRPGCSSPQSLVS